MRSLQRRIHRADSGFGLIEVIVALVIAGIVFSALASVLVASVQASLFGRQNQQATDFMTREIETLRAADFGSLSNVAANVAADPRLSACAPSRCLTVNGTPEAVVTGLSGVVPTAITVLNSAETNKTAFTVSRYITTIADQPVDQARRATVFISWMNKGVLKTRSISTVIAYTQRGLPLPVFKLLLPVPAITVSKDARATYTLTVINQGAPDRFSLALTGATSGWKFYADPDNDGVLDTGTGQITDTGLLYPSGSFRFFLTRDNMTVTTMTTTVTATSMGQPTASTAVKSVVATTVGVVGAVPPTPGPTPTPTVPVSTETTCPAPSVVTASANNNYSLNTYALHSAGAGDTVLESQMYLSATAANGADLRRYSTNIDAIATGRVLAPALATSPTAAAVIGLTDSRVFADWALQFGTAGKVDGKSVLRLWAARYGVGVAPVTVKVVLYTATGSATGLARTVLGEKEVSLGTLPCVGFQEFYIELSDVDKVVIPKDAWVGVRVVTSGSDQLRLGYDASPQFPASFTIGVF